MDDFLPKHSFRKVSKYGANKLGVHSKVFSPELALFDFH